MSKKKEKKINYENTKYIAFKFMYIGKNYDGLVLQSSTKNTIEEILFNSFKRCKFLDPSKNNDELISLSNYSRCGRTDKGVNSSGNVFALNLRYEDKYDYVKALNSILPNDIFILSSIIVDDSFDPRFSCLYREYKYYFLKKNMNIKLMQKAANFLCGFHNFKNFCKVDKSDENWEEKNYERRIFEIRIERVKEENIVYPFDIKQNIIKNEYYQSYVCIIKGTAFLWHQVRCIMKILFLIGEELEDINLINEMLNIKSNYEFKYGLADDSNLILSDCVFEFINFNNNNDINNNNCELYIKLEKLYTQNLMQCIINTHFFNIMFNNNFQLFTKNEKNIDYENIFKKVNESRKKNKYTKLLQIKTNRMKDLSDNKKTKK
jgi:tRNA pseudouridine38/39 synthase